jgi:transposase
VAASATPATLADHLPTRRPRHYPSDTSDAEWAILAPQIPAGSGRGRPVCYPQRDVVDAIRYWTAPAASGRHCPADFPHPKLRANYTITRRWQPGMDSDERARAVAAWRSGVDRTLGLTRPIGTA